MKKKKIFTDSSSTSSTLSCRQLNLILEKLKGSQHRDSTKTNYLRIWRNFNLFLMRLDHRPKDWEDRASLFAAFLVHHGTQSTTLRSYISAIKTVLKSDRYPWRDDKILLGTIARACRLENDCIRTKLPIHFALFEMLMFQLNRHLGANQRYLCTMYQALFCLGYYSLMCIGELTESLHALRAANIHVGCNKNKILLFLYSSKTHNKESALQQIKISQCENTGKRTKNFCPFLCVRNFIELRGPFTNNNEMFFLLRDRSPVTAIMVRNILDTLFKRINLDYQMYSFHCFRSGRASDLLKYGFSVEQIKKMGRWKSNAVYRYLK